MQHAPINNPARYRLEKFGMRNAPEVVREVGVNDFRMAAEQLRIHLGHRLLGIAPGTVGVLLWWKIGFEDRFQHQHRCRHADPIPHGRDAQWPEFAIGLRYVHSSDRVRSIRLLPERKRQFAKPPLHPVRFDFRKVLTVHARCALVGAALSIGMGQDVFPADLAGHRSGSRLLPSLSRATPSAVSEHSSELIGCPIPRSLTTSCVRLELRSLPSTGITQLHRYCEPLRIPTAPGLSLAGVRLIIPDHVVGPPVLRTLSLCTCCRHYPGAAAGRMVSLSNPAMSAFPERVIGSACASSFSRLSRRSLALRPAHSRCHRIS